MFVFVLCVNVYEFTISEQRQNSVVKDGLDADYHSILGYILRIKTCDMTPTDQCAPSILNIQYHIILRHVRNLVRNPFARLDPMIKHTPVHGAPVGAAPLEIEEGILHRIA